MNVLQLLIEAWEKFTQKHNLKIKIGRGDPDASDGIQLHVSVPDYFADKYTDGDIEDLLEEVNLRLVYRTPAKDSLVWLVIALNQNKVSDS